MRTLDFFSIALAFLALTLAHAENTTPQSRPTAQSSWSDQKRQDNFNLQSGELGAHGYDPVSYFENHPTEGKKTITSAYKGVTYRFANTANKQKFDADPARYEPAYGGWCAWAMAKDGDKVDIDPTSYKIVDGRLFLFYNGIWGDTRKQWTDSGQEKQLTQDANVKWAKLTE